MAYTKHSAKCLHKRLSFKVQWFYVCFRTIRSDSSTRNLWTSSWGEKLRRICTTEQLNRDQELEMSPR